jgi:hypothetical protein
MANKPNIQSKRVNSHTPSRDTIYDRLSYRPNVGIGNKIIALQQNCEKCYQKQKW